MTDGDRGPATEAELRAKLETMLRQARDSGVDVRGAWECRGDEEQLDLDVVVTELQTGHGDD